MPPSVFRVPPLACQPSIGAASGSLTIPVSFPPGLGVGAVVAIVGDRTGSVYAVDRANPQDLVNFMPAVGVLTTLVTPTTGTVTTLGEVTGLSGLTPGEPLWVSLTGTVISGDNSSIVPAVEGLGVGLQSLGVALASDVALLIPQLPMIRRYTP